jgi:hypothetical protein
MVQKQKGSEVITLSSANIWRKYRKEIGMMLFLGLTNCVLLSFGI